MVVSRRANQCGQISKNLKWEGMRTQKKMYKVARQLATLYSYLKYTGKIGKV